MPIIQVNLLQGRATEAKRKFAADVTRLACEHLGVRAEQVRVIFNEMPRENYAIAGTLVADRDNPPTAATASS
jgi:4-oxalocrotonate tautomerase family enzyme